MSIQVLKCGSCRKLLGFSSANTVSLQSLRSPQSNKKKSLDKNKMSDETGLVKFYCNNKKINEAADDDNTKKTIVLIKKIGPSRGVFRRVIAKPKDGEPIDEVLIKEKKTYSKENSNGKKENQLPKIEQKKVIFLIFFKFFKYK